MKDIFGKRLIMAGLIVFSGFNVFFLQVSLANPHIQETDQYYSIIASNASEARSEINLKRPRFDANTNWHVDWRYEYEKMSHGCRLRSIATSVSIQYTYPRWENLSSQSQSMQNKWSEYFESLRKHEKGHADIAVQAAVDIENHLNGLSTSDSCAALGEKANSIGSGILEKARKQDIEYDDQTDHGKNQGARFP